MVRVAVLIVVRAVIRKVGRRIREIAGGEMGLVAYVTGLLLRLMVIIRLRMVRLVVVLLLVFGHLHPISLVTLSSIHHPMLRLMSVMIVHIEGIVRGSCVYWGSRRRGCIVIEGSPST